MARSNSTIAGNWISPRTEPSHLSTATTGTACVSAHHILDRPRAASCSGSCSRWCVAPKRSAESLSSDPYAADAHDRNCSCGTHCRHDSCCCGRGSATRGGSEASERRSFPQGERRSGPCLGDAPCGDPGLPSSTPPSSSGRAAALAVTADIQPATTGNLLASPESCRLHPRWSSRVDRPPRRYPLA